MLYSLFEWMESWGIAQTIGNSVVAFPILQAFHLLSLAVLGGAVLMVDLRILGFGLRNQPVEQLARLAYPWLVVSTIVIIVTGVLMTSSLAATRYYWNEAFWVKMVLLALAIVFTFIIRHRYAMSGEPRASSTPAKITAALSALLWLNVGIAGRAIGFV